MPLAKSHIFVARGFEKASSPAVSSRTSDATCCNGCLTHLYTVHVCVPCLLILRVRTNEPIWPIYQPVHIYIYNHSFVCRCLLFGIVYVCMHNDVYIYIHIWNYDDDHICRHTLCGHTLCEHALLTVRCAILRLTLIPVSQSRTWGALSMKIYMWNHSMCYYGINMDKPYPNIIGIADISTSGFFLEWFLPVRWRPTAAG